ncbi:MAG: hypothetical protein AAF502_19450 [Bacteroidota bacterium]
MQIISIGAGILVTLFFLIKYFRTFKNLGYLFFSVMVGVGVHLAIKEIAATISLFSIFLMPHDQRPERISTDFDILSLTILYISIMLLISLYKLYKKSEVFENFKNNQPVIPLFSVKDFKATSDSNWLSFIRKEGQEKLELFFKESRNYAQLAFYIAAGIGFKLGLSDMHEDDYYEFEYFVLAANWAFFFIFDSWIIMHAYSENDRRGILAKHRKKVYYLNILLFAVIPLGIIFTEEGNISALFSNAYRLKAVFTITLLLGLTLAWRHYFDFNKYPEPEKNMKVTETAAA